MSGTLGQIYGLQSGSAGGDTINIGAGEARDSTDSDWIGIPTGETRTIDITTTGQGGLDAGSLQANTSYAVWVAKATASGAVTAFISASFSPSGVTVPSGVVVRRVGSISTDGSMKVHAFTQAGNGPDRNVFYDGATSTLSRLINGSATTFTEVDLQPLVPLVAPATTLYIVPSGTLGNSSSVQPTSGGPALTVYSPSTLGFIPSAGTSRMDYKNDKSGGLTDVYVLGYQDEL